MARTLGAYRGDARAYVGYPPDDVLTDDEVDRRINEAYLEICRMFRHDNLRATATGTTVADQATYALPSTFWFNFYLKDTTNDQRIVNKDLEWMLNQDISGSNIETGEPLYWSRESRGHFRMHPVPDDAYAYKFWFYERPVVLSSANQLDALEEEWNEIILLGVVQRLFGMLGEYDRQVQSLNLQRHLINSITEFDELDDDFGVDIVGPMEDLDKRSS
jgi:hypothetical protein